MSQLVDICTYFAQLALPQDCLLCGAPSDQNLLCKSCRADLPWHPEMVCPVCAMPSPQAAICGACLKRPPAFDTTCAALSYRFPLDALLHAFKYGERLALGDLLGQLLAEKAAQAPPPDVLLAMPLHPERLQERGFNQAAELARIVAKKLRLPLDLDACTRARATSPQAGLPLSERTKNLRGAFACNPSVAGKRVAVVDDVMTSGATLNELARTLKRSGAVEVSCWVVARTLAD